MAGDFKGLNIKDRELIISKVEEFLINKFGKAKVGSEFVKKGNISRLNFETDECESFLDFYFTGNGKTTIQPNSGGTKELNLEIANYLKNELCSLLKSNSTLSVKGVNKADFDSFIDIVNENKEWIETITQTDTSSQLIDKTFSIKGKYDDTVTLTYYSSGTVFLQGRPLKAFSEMTTFVTEVLVTSDEVISVLNLTYKTTVSRNEVEDEYQKRLEHIDSDVNVKLEKVLKQAVYQIFIDDSDYIEYTGMLFPALRALEGVMKYFVNEQSLPKRIILKEKPKWLTMGDYCEVADDQTYILKNEYSTGVNEKLRKQFGVLYSKYHDLRNVYFHWGNVDYGVDDTKLVGTKEQAISKIYDILDAIDAFYSYK